MLHRDVRLVYLYYTFAATAVTRCVRTHFIPTHLEPATADLGRGEGIVGSSAAGGTQQTSGTLTLTLTPNPNT